MNTQNNFLRRSLGSLSFLATLALASGGIVPAAFAQTATDTSSTTAPTYCNTSTSTEGYFVTTDMGSYSQGQSINFCLTDNTRTPLFLSGTHPWIITDQNGNTIFTPNPGTLTSSSSSSFFNDMWNGMNASSTNLHPGTYNVVFSGFPGSPSALFTITAASSTSSSTGSTGSTTSGTGTSTGTTGSTTSTSTPPVDWSSLISQLQSLEATLSSLLQQIQAALNNGNNSGNGSGTGMNGSAMIDQNGSIVSAGSSIDFTGRNFMHEENVTVSLNGSTVATAHADGGGNFSTGSVSVPHTAGTYMYTFTGQHGDVGMATITVH